MIKDNVSSDHERFTEGDCHILALELERISGGKWKVATLICESHAFVVDPDTEMALDIEGKRPVNELLQMWSAEDYHIVNDKHFKTEWDYDPITRKGEMFISSQERARDVAQQILKGTYNED